MRKIPTTFAIYLILTSVAVSQEPDEDLHNKCIYPTVLVCSSKGNESYSGSGVIIKSKKVSKNKYENLVLTCNHVLIEGKDVQVGITIANYENWSKCVSFTRYSRSTKVVYTDEELDIALVQFNSNKQLSVADINEKPNLFVGNDVVRIGCGLGEPYRLDYGKVTGVAGSLTVSKVQRHMVRTSIFSMPGDSGGPVFNGYKLVGIKNSIKKVDNAGYSHPIHQVSFFTPVESFINKKEFAKHLGE